MIDKLVRENNLDMINHPVHDISDLHSDADPEL